MRKLGKKSVEGIFSRTRSDGAQRSSFERDRCSSRSDFDLTTLVQISSFPRDGGEVPVAGQSVVGEIFVRKQ